MSNFVRAIGKAFGFGDPKVNKSLMGAANREKLNEQGKTAALEGEAEAQRIRSANGGRRAALASQVRDTLG